MGKKKKNEKKEELSVDLRQRFRTRSDHNETDNSKHKRVDPNSVGFGDLLRVKKNKHDSLIDIWEHQRKGELDSRPEPFFEQFSLKLRKIKKTIIIRAKVLFAKWKSGNLKFNLRSKSKVFFGSKKRTFAFIMGSLLVVIFMGTIFNKNSFKKETLGTNNENNSTSVNQITSEDADFDVLTPATEEAKHTDSYDSLRGVVTFQDKINSKDIVISQQKIPDEIANNEFNLKKLVSSLQGVISVSQLQSKDRIFYVANYENNDQTVVFTTNELLVFMTSKQNIDPSEWISYVDSLN